MREKKLSKCVFFRLFWLWASGRSQLLNWLLLIVSRGSRACSFALNKVWIHRVQYNEKAVRVKWQTSVLVMKCPRFCHSNQVLGNFGNFCTFLLKRALRAKRRWKHKKCHNSAKNQRNWPLFFASDTWGGSAHSGGPWQAKLNGSAGHNQVEKFIGGSIDIAPALAVGATGLLSAGAPCCCICVIVKAQLCVFGLESTNYWLFR